MNSFTKLHFSTSQLDLYYIRTSIFNALCKSLPMFKGDLLDIGCGKMPYKEYILENAAVDSYLGLDIENALIYDETVKPDVTWDGVQMPFKDASFDTAFGTEVLEHCPEPDVTLKEVYRVLKSDGVFFFTVPFLWNLHEAPNDYYRYTPFALELHLKEAGFQDIELYATGGWHASMAQMLGLWVKRSPMSSLKKKIGATCLKPIIKALIKWDSKQKVELKDGQMITGLYGTAIKK
ncbi:class I SAM-dependent methyltransferase [Nonlabens sp. SY33080]|uniref:class I SAM-dependent methyltransferase n=1 Tax=Nonlabens sp. SY33080 TaxID=2719911 RepID=UPI001428AA39|nr:class I SAM-dependent methyltransferase [Nonlabens sp. SY33080]